MIKTIIFPYLMQKGAQVAKDGALLSKGFGKPIQKGQRGKLGNILELRTGYSCNNDCQYCPVSHKRHLTNRTTQDCKNILQENRQERNLLIISGGEPTIRTDFLELIASARDLDYQWIQLKTNGRMFCRKDFARNLIEVIKQHPVSNEQRDIENLQGYNFGGLDIFEFYVSLPAVSSKLHDLITGVRDSFKETIQGIKNLLSFNQIVTMNVVVTKLNYRHLPEIVKYFDDWGLKYIEFSFVEPEGKTLANFEDIVPSIAEVKPYLLRAIDRREPIYKRFINPRLLQIYGLDRHVPIYIKSFPRCCVREKECHLSEESYPYDRHNMYKLIDLNATTTYYEKQIKSNTKKDDCQYCIYDPICYGLNKIYCQKRGFDELTPILGNSIGILVEREKIADFKNLESVKLSDLRLEFDNPKLKVNFGDTRADTIAMLSGGVDSSLMAAIYAQTNPDKKIALVTFSECHSPGAEGSRLPAEWLMKNYKNIVNHFIVPVPYILSKKIIFEDLERDYQRLNWYPACVRCEYLRLSYCVYLLKKYFGGDTLISGLRKSENPFMQKYEYIFLNKYSVKILRPLADMDKIGTIKWAEMMDLPYPKNSDCSGQSPHSDCLLSSLKTRLSLKAKLEKMDFDKDLIFENEEKKFRDLLKYNGISETVTA